MSSLTYGDRLKKLCLETLELRRLKSDLLLVFKIIHGLINVDKNIFEFCCMPVLRGHNCKLVKPLSKVNCRYHSFVSRVVDPWNNLTHLAIDAPSIVAFKHILNTLDFSKFLNVNID